MKNLPERYLRNKILTTAEQELLAQSKVFVLGLGGLGGHVFDMLLRLGIGEIVAADGDVFEASNLNRQLLSNEDNIGLLKAKAALLYAQKINSGIKVTTYAEYLRGQELEKRMTGCTLAVDCLGGLAEKIELERAAKNLNIPLVSAGIAGFTGWLAILDPKSCKPSPATLMFDEKNTLSAEDKLGNIVSTVCFTAALQVQAVINIICHKKITDKMLIFDLQSMDFNSVEL